MAEEPGRNSSDYIIDICYNLINLKIVEIKIQNNERERKKIAGQ